MHETLVSDELWKIIEPLLPPDPSREKGGRPRIPNRNAFAGIVYVLKSGVPWRMLSKEVGGGSGTTCWRRLRGWQKAGVWWYGRQRHVTTQRRTTASDGTPRYGKTRKSTPAPREEWIAVPVPDASIPKEWVLAAREAIRENEWASNAGYRTWELSGGVLRCASCGRTMSVNYIAAKDRGYYRCTGRYNGGVENRCSASRTVRAEKAEAEIWEFVRSVLTDPALLVAGLENMH